MEHLEFINELNKLGILVRGTNIERKEKVYHVPYGLHGAKVSVSGFDVKYLDRIDRDAFEQLIKACIDLDSWKHSWHMKIDNSTLEESRRIIQDKIIDRANDIEMLMTTYFLINKRLSEIQAE